LETEKHVYGKKFIDSLSPSNYNEIGKQDIWIEAFQKSTDLGGT
jgi:hypothetical protein